MMKKKVIVMGSGPGGYVSAIRAAQMGAEVALIEKDRAGGTCNNIGCIPTKTLLNSVEILSKIKKAEDYGIEVGDVNVNITEMMARKERVVAGLQKSLNNLFKSNKIRFLKGKARLIDPTTVEVEKEGGEKESISADDIIIATGSDPAKIPIFDFDQPTVMTSTDALYLKEVPRSMIILGAGAIGCEFAGIFNPLGTKITMVEMMPQMLPTEDRRIAIQLKRIFNRRGIRVLTGTKIEGISRYEQDSITAKLDNGEEITAEKILVSIGRKPNSSQIGLDEASVKTDKRGYIKVNETMETNVEGIYAIGDVIGGVMLAHVASAEGIVAAENIMGNESKMDYGVIPSCIFTSPEIASVGINPAQAKERNIDTIVGRFNFLGSSKAQAMGETEGFIQLVVDKNSDKILGGQIMGAHATDLIHEIALAVKAGITSEEIGSTVHAHPTLSEAIRECAENAHGRAIHLIKMG